MNDLDHVPTPTRVVTARMSLSHRLPKAVERVALTRTADAARHRYFSRSCVAVNQDAVTRKSHVTALAGRDDQAEVAKKRLFVRQRTSAKARILVRPKIVAA